MLASLAADGPVVRLLCAAQACDGLAPRQPRTWQAEASSLQGPHTITQSWYHAVKDLLGEFLTHDGCPDAALFTPASCRSQATTLTISHCERLCLVCCRLAPRPSSHSQVNIGLIDQWRQAVEAPHAHKLDSRPIFHRRQVSVDCLLT